jgi:integrase
MSRQLPKVRVQALAERPEKAQPYIVRWSFDGVQRSKAFPYQTPADRWRSKLVTAASEETRWNAKTGLPTTWDATDQMDVAEWSRRYVLAKWAKRAPQTRRSLAEAIALLVEHSAPARANMTKVQRHELRVWLTPIHVKAQRWELSGGAPDSLAQWLSRWSPVLVTMDKNDMYRLDARLRLRQDGVTPLAPRTAKRVVSTAKGCIAEAVRAGLLEESLWPEPPSDGADLKTERELEAPTDFVVPSQERFRLLLDAMTSHQPMSWGYRAMTAVSGWSGLRPGEVMALTVEDLTLPDEGWGSIRVTKSYHGTHDLHTEPGNAIGLPKTTRSRRDVPIPQVLVAELRKWLVRADITCGMLFVTRSGRCPSISNWRRTLIRGCTKVGIEDMSPYDLRHACASWLSMAGVEIAEAAQRMGHSPTVMLRYYTQRVEGATERANTRLADLYGE